MRPGKGENTGDFTFKTNGWEIRGMAGRIRNAPHARKKIRSQTSVLERAQQGMSKCAEELLRLYGTAV